MLACPTVRECGGVREKSPVAKFLQGVMLYRVGQMSIAEQAFTARQGHTLFEWLSSLCYWFCRALCMSMAQRVEISMFEFLAKVSICAISSGGRCSIISL